jgi:hypothetical protein
VHRDLGRREQLIVKISAVLGWWSGGQLGEGDAVDAPNPTRKVALVGEACASCDFSQAGLPLVNQLDRLLQSEMHDPAVRGHANRSGEYAREVEWATPCYICQQSNLDRLIEVGNDIVSEPLEHLLAQRPSPPALSNSEV